ncbi:helix-turn-helix domain-containing protein [Sideroxydans sp.]
MENKPKRKAAAVVKVVAAANQIKLAHYATLLKRFPGNDANTQRTRLYLALQHAPISTYEARKYLDIYHPNARALELRAQGMSIATLRIAQQTDAGVIHRRIGLYVLQSGEVRHE